MEATEMNQTPQTSDALSDSVAVETTDANELPHAEPAPESTVHVINEELGEFGDAADTSLTEVIDTAEAKRALEAALLAASEPMGLNELKRLFEGQLSPDVIRNLLEELRTEWDDRSVELAVVASGYRFRVKPVYQKYLERLSSDKPLKYSRAVMETLAIIAYRQPVTRGDIEDIRGVAVSPHILKTLEDRGWIDEIGNRDTVGRPALFATTKHFLDDLNLRSLEELPPLHELQATLDMTQAGAALVASESPYLSLPGVEGVNQATESAEMTDGELAGELETAVVDAEPGDVVEGAEHQP
jgi:segregation and condensation protein B